MREILFRGKTITSKEWIYGDLLQYAGGAQIWENTEQGKFNAQIIPETVGQYTGLCDKNGTKIFEGDILSEHLDELFPNEESRYLVVWHDYGWHIKCGNESFDTLEQWWVREFFNVIGNIYDNPELLKGNE